jgi:hypothetical protein
MQDVHSFEYAIIRVVPKVEREEFINVGVILYCHSHKFLHVMINVDDRKLNVLSEETDVEELKEHLNAFEEICTGSNQSSPIARMDMASRFRWLTAARSTIVQTSKVHPGICTEPKEIIKKLYGEYVL